MSKIDLSKLVTAEQKVEENKTLTISRYDASIEEYLNSQAITLGYVSMDRAISYADEPVVPKFQQEGKALRAWRSIVWDYAHTQMNAVLEGTRKTPTVTEFIRELPKFSLEEEIV